MLKTTEELISKTITEGTVNIIYGAGWAGQEVLKFLKGSGVLVKAFAVTRLDQAEIRQGIPVYSLDNIFNSTPLRLENVNIILGVTESNKLSMKAELKKRNINSYIELSKALIYEITRKNRQLDAEVAEMSKKPTAGQIAIGYLFPGYLDTNYAEERLIIGKVEDTVYIKMPKETARITCIGTQYEKDIESHRKLTEACYSPSKYVPDVDLIHTFNMVCSIDRPWCASFETSMPCVWPRTEEENEYFRRLLYYMERSNCKALYALSGNAYKIQKNMLENRISESRVDMLMKKTKVLHPPQPILISKEEFNKKHDIQKIHFIFIGRSFFIKGGKEMLQVLSEFESRYDFKLTLISSMEYDDYFTHAPYEEMVKCREVIKKKAWIDYYESLPNKMVLEKCKQASVGIFPSVGDTYGYVVLETQAAGCPVITTNIRAFPEINNNECGWICEVPVDSFGICIRDREIWSKILRQELRKCLQDIFDHQDSIKEKGKKAIERIRNMHDPYKYQKELSKLLY